ncbi:uncharacterized protein LOC111869249 [Cryptotermes secundus]|uniref:uncharacterized protein LOC111869249 n=1 Tax=Cryptotermes secundus TaxID=105785 RepID=UPI000CD7DC05|nr:uncharacterized protein LOC111869249 [Cryptotermes secundus]
MPWATIQDFDFKLIIALAVARTTRRLHGILVTADIAMAAARTTRLHGILVTADISLAVARITRRLHGILVTADISLAVGKDHKEVTWESGDSRPGETMGVYSQNLLCPLPVMRATNFGLKSSRKMVKARHVSVTAYHDHSMRCCNRRKHLHDIT